MGIILWDRSPSRNQSKKNTKSIILGNHPTEIDHNVEMHCDFLMREG